MSVFKSSIMKDQHLLVPACDVLPLFSVLFHLSYNFNFWSDKTRYVLFYHGLWNNMAFYQLKI